MSFLKNPLKNIYRPESYPAALSSFEHLGEEAIEQHLQKARYGSFLLTDAVRPGYDLQVIPKQGFRHDTLYQQDERSNSGYQIPTLAASISQPELFDTFLEMLNPLGDMVDIILQSSHRHEQYRAEFFRDRIDLPVLKSVLIRHESMILNDGCTGIAVMNPEITAEVQFDEHKLIVVYCTRLKPWERILLENDIYCNEQLLFLNESEHVHCSSSQYSDEFQELKFDLGME